MFRNVPTAVVAVCALFAHATDAEAADPIRIGSFLAVTGPASFLGDPELRTLQLYVAEVNAGGGVLGRPLELVHYDVQHDANKAITAAKRLTANDRVDFIIGGSTTGTTMAAVPVIERSGTPFISMAAGVPIAEPVKPWVFKVAHSDAMACAKIFEDMRGRGIARIGLISGTGGFGKSMRGQCQKLAPSYGIEIVADETYGPKDSDMTAQLTKIKNTDGVEAVLCAGFGQGPAVVTRNYGQLAMADIPMYQSHGIASKSYIDLAGPASEGVRLPAAALVVADKLPDDDPQKPVVMAYKTKYETATGDPVSTFGGHAHDGLKIVIAAIHRAGGTDKVGVRDEIEKTTGFMGTAGVFNISATDHVGLDLSAFRMLEIRDGDWTLID